MSLPTDTPTQLCECGCGEAAPISTNTHAARGYVRGEPRRFIHGHNGRRKPGPLYVAEDRGYETWCWIWQGATTGAKGYGYYRKRIAHRVFYEERYGPVPDDLQLDHLCRVRLCVNPDHLEVVTCQENIQRGWLARGGRRSV